MSITDMKVNEELILSDGEVILQNGGNVNEYLSQWQKENNLEDGTPVNIVTRKDLKRLMELARCAGIA